MPPLPPPRKIPVHSACVCLYTNITTHLCLVSMQLIHCIGILYVLLNDGNIYVMDYSTNPCTLKETWSTLEHGRCVYGICYYNITRVHNTSNGALDNTSRKCFSVT